MGSGDIKTTQRGGPETVLRSQSHRHGDPRALAMLYVYQAVKYLISYGNPARRRDQSHAEQRATGLPTHVDDCGLICRLCRCRHNRHYADIRIMPMSKPKTLVAGGVSNGEIGIITALQEPNRGSERAVPP